VVFAQCCAGRQFVKGRPTHQTRAARARREFLKRLGVWIFILFFALSVAGGLIIVTTSLRNP
jgi:preprotein translocase subunit SecG